MDVQSEDDDYLDYLITVDIFSEGTDIVEVNQVIMLRPTQSPIVFIQQLGRGLQRRQRRHVRPPVRGPGSSPRRHKHIFSFILFPFES